jgi:hypothetical protein
MGQTPPGRVWTPATTRIRVGAGFLPATRLPFWPISHPVGSPARVVVCAKGEVPMVAPVAPPSAEGLAALVGEPRLPRAWWRSARTTWNAKMSLTIDRTNRSLRPARSGLPGSYGVNARGGGTCRLSRSACRPSARSARASPPPPNALPGPDIARLTCQGDPEDNPLHLHLAAPGGPEGRIPTMVIVRTTAVTAAAMHGVVNLRPAALTALELRGSLGAGLRACPQPPGRGSPGLHRG